MCAALPRCASSHPEIAPIAPRPRSPWAAGYNNWHPPLWLKHNPDLGIKYFHSFFWGAGMVTSLVPRDIEPLTVLECIITNATMFFGLLLNAFVISSLTQALASMNARKELAGKQLEQIKNYLIIKSVPRDLRDRVLEYYEYLFTSSAALDNMNMFEHIPPSLSYQLALSTNRRLATHCAFFRSVSDGALVTLLSEFKALVFVPNQVIVKETMPVSSAYFINRGRVQMSERGEPSMVLTNTDNFGLEEYMNSLLAYDEPKVRYTATAITYCDMMYLPIETMSEHLKTDAQFQAYVNKRRDGHAAGGSGHNRSTTGKWRLTKLGGLSSKTSQDLTMANLSSTCAATGTTSPIPIAAEESEISACVKLAARMSARGVGPDGSSPSRTVSYGGECSCATDSANSTSRTPGAKLRAAIFRAAARVSVLHQHLISARSNNTQGSARSSPSSRSGCSQTVTGTSSGSGGPGCGGHGDGALSA